MKRISLNQLGQQARRFGVRGLVTALIVGSTAIATAGEYSIVETDVMVEEEESPFEKWWTGKYATGDWFGVRSTLEDNGLRFKNTYKGIGFLNTAGRGLGGSAEGTYVQELKFRAYLDFEKMVGLKGFTGYVDGRWRNGKDPNRFVGAEVFKPSNINSGMLWRMGSFWLSYSTTDLLPVEDMIQITGGWLNPYNFFAKQKPAKLFVNNGVASSLGIGDAGAPWSSSFNTWGGVLKIKPIDQLYVQGFLGMSYPSGTSTANNGLAFQGFGPDTSRNGLYAVAEAGWEPEFGASELPGKYAAGGWYFGTEFRSFFGTPYDKDQGKFGFYFQAEQMLFREPPIVTTTEVYSKGGKGGYSKGGKNYKEPIIEETVELNDQGLSWFGFLSFAPKYFAETNIYSHTGFVYKGLIPTRDKDDFGIVFGLAGFSYYQLLADRADGDPGRTYEAIVEIDYKFKVNNWAYVRPFWQYIIRPDGAGVLPNANVFGAEFQVTF